MRVAAPRLHQPLAQPQWRIRRNLTLNQSVQKLMPQSGHEQLARSQRRQRLRCDPVAFGKRRNPPRRKRRVAKRPRGPKRAHRNRLPWRNTRPVFRFAKRLRQLRQISRIRSVQRLQYKAFRIENLPLPPRRLVRGYRAGKILRKNLRGVAPRRPHRRRSRLAKPHPVPRPAPMKEKMAALRRNLKPCAENLVPAQCAPHSKPKILR